MCFHWSLGALEIPLLSTRPVQELCGTGKALRPHASSLQAGHRCSRKKANQAASVQKCHLGLFNALENRPVHGWHQVKTIIRRSDLSTLLATTSLKTRLA